MTWTYELTEAGDCTVHDHTGAQVTTISNDGSGIRLPGDVEQVMLQDAQGARRAGDMQRWREIHIRLAAGQIEEREDSA